MKIHNLFYLCFFVHFAQGDITEVILGRQSASTFHQRTKRGLYHECYSEACEYEEVREVYPYNTQKRWEYWYDFRCWKSGYACKVNCVHRQSCSTGEWSSWHGVVGTEYRCYTQTRQRLHNYAKETTQRRFNCNGLYTSCPVAPTEQRQVCVCQQAVCAPSTWTSWSPGLPLRQCITQNRRKSDIKSVVSKQNFGSCSGISSSCSKDEIQTRQQCSCAKADCTLNTWSNWHGDIEEGKCSKQERNRTYSFSLAYEIYNACPGNLPKSCPTTLIAERVKCSCRYAVCSLDKVWSNWQGSLDTGKCNQVQTRYRRYKLKWAYEEHIVGCPLSLSQSCPEDLSETRHQCICEYRDSCETHPWSPWSNHATQLGCQPQTRQQQYKHPLKKIQKTNCDGLLACKSPPVQMRTYCRCEDIECFLQPWSAWTPQLNGSECVRQLSTQDYKKSVRYVFRNDSCSGLNTDCPSDNERSRTMCNCNFQTYFYSNWREWQGDVPEEGCTTQVRTKAVSQSSNHILKENNCDGLNTFGSLPEINETRKICNCRYREDCTLLEWGEWSGDKVTKIDSCRVQIRSRAYNNTAIVKQQLNNCDGLPKRCAVVDKEETRYQCKCLRQNCNWTDWFEDGIEGKSNCKRFSRVRNITVSSAEVETFGNCDNVVSNCNAHHKETVKKCGVQPVKITVMPKEANATKPTQPPTLEPIVIKYVPIGCYKDSSTNRALPQLIKNLRDDIDWYNMEKTVKGCVDYAAKLRYSYVAVQFYGECWSGEDFLQKYNLYGRSKKCWNGVGKGLTNFVYKIIELPESTCTNQLEYKATFTSGEYVDGEWCTEEKEDKTPQLMLTFDTAQTVTGFATKGHDADNFVTVYEIDYSIVGVDVLRYKESGIPKLFAEDSNRFTTEVHWLKIGVTAKTFVFRPKQWQADKLCMDVDVYGCPAKN